MTLGKSSSEFNQWRSRRSRFGSGQDSRGAIECVHVSRTDRLAIAETAASSIPCCSKFPSLPLAMVNSLSDRTKSSADTKSLSAFGVCWSAKLCGAHSNKLRSISLYGYLCNPQIHSNRCQFPSLELETIVYISKVWRFSSRLHFLYARND